MCRLKLIKGRSYTGYGVKVSAESPCVDVVKKEVADALIASGYFSLIEEAADGGNSGGDKPIEKMTEKELDAYAAENGIDLAGVSGKAKKLAKIQEVLAAAETGDDNDDGDNDGSDLFNDED